MFWECFEEPCNDWKRLVSFLIQPSQIHSLPFKGATSRFLHRIRQLWNSTARMTRASETRSVKSSCISWINAESLFHLTTAMHIICTSQANKTELMVIQRSQREQTSWNMYHIFLTSKFRATHKEDNSPTGSVKCSRTDRVWLYALKQWWKKIEQWQGSK